MTAAGVDVELAEVAALLRTHPDVTSGPSVRAVLAAAELYVAVGAVAGDGPPQEHLVRLLRAALLSLPHRLRVRPGADAVQIVWDAVLAVARPATEPDEPPENREAQAPLQTRPVFRLGDGGIGSGAARDRAGLPGAEPEIAALLVDVLRPTRRGPLADGLTPGPARPPSGERGAPTRMRPGDPSRDLSVRASLRAALRDPTASADPATWPSDALRVRPPRPDVALDVVLALDISASMAGAEVTPLARAITGAVVRAGHRVALQVFAATSAHLCGFTRDPARLLAAAGHYEPAHPTNLEAAIFAAHDLLAREGSRSRAGVILLVTDAEPTVCGTPRRRARGYGAAISRLAAADAAAAANADGITVSVLCPPRGTVERIDEDFASRLATAGGGTARSYPASPSRPHL
jgi:Mg-chelatase subunit ChlD